MHVVAEASLPHQVVVSSLLEIFDTALGVAGLKPRVSMLTWEFAPGGRRGGFG